MPPGPINHGSRNTTHLCNTRFSRFSKAYPCLFNKFDHKLTQ